jgi:hypothetical protein
MRSERIAFQLGAGLLVMGALAHIVTLWPRVATLSRLLPTGVWLFFVGYALSAFTALLACGLAAFLLIKAADRTDARLLTLFLAFLAFYWGSLFRFMNIEATENSVNLQIQYGDGWISQSAVAAFVLAVAAFVHFSIRFPAALTPDRLARAGRLRAWRGATLNPLFLWGSAIVLILTARFVPDVAASLLGLRAETAAPPPPAMVSIVAAIAVLCLAYVIAGVILGTINLRTSYRIATAQERKRVLWVVSGFMVAAFMLLAAGGLIVLVAATDIPAPIFGVAGPLIVLAPLVLVTCAAIGVLYAGAIDPALVLRRSTVWGALAAIGLVLFTAIENALSALIEQRLGLPGFVAAVAAGLIVTVVLIPVRARVQSWVNAHVVSATEPRPLTATSTPAAAAESAPPLPVTETQ